MASTIVTFEACTNQFKILRYRAVRWKATASTRISIMRRQQIYVYTESTVGNTLDLPTDTQPEEYRKINIYYKIVDYISVNLKRRFKNLPLANALDAFLKLDMENGDAK